MTGLHPHPTQTLPNHFVGRWLMYQNLLKRWHPHWLVGDLNCSRYETETDLASNTRNKNLIKHPNFFCKHYSSRGITDIPSTEARPKPACSCYQDGPSSPLARPPRRHATLPSLQSPNKVTRRAYCEFVNNQQVSFYQELTFYVIWSTSRNNDLYITSDKPKHGILAAQTSLMT